MILNLLDWALWFNFPLMLKQYSMMAITTCGIVYVRLSFCIAFAVRTSFMCVCVRVCSRACVVLCNGSV